MDFGARHGPTLLEANPGVALHHMHDPNQDALTSSQMAYFRLKWHRLPGAYARFLEERLLPGAPVLVVHDESTWPVSRLGDRHVFQLGAQGGMAAEEYLQAPGAPHPDQRAPEAEWGLDDSLLDSVHDWAGRHRHPVVDIRYGHPQAPASAVAETIRGSLRERGEPGERLLVSSFVVHDPWRTLTSASVPFWTFFPVQPAADDLAGYLDQTSYDDIDIMLFNHGTRSRGLAPASSWQRLADRAGHTGRLLAVDASAFPDDFAVFARYSRALRALPDAARPWRPLPVDDALAGLGQSPRITLRRGYPGADSSTG